MTTEATGGRTRLGRRRILGVSVALAALLGTAACATGGAASSDGSASSEPPGIEDRQANWIVNQLYVCIQNKTERPISLEWSEYMKNTSGNQLDREQLTKTLGQDAFDCAVSYSHHWNEHAEFKIEGTTLIATNSGAIWYFGRNYQDYELLQANTWNTWPFVGSTAEQRSYDMRAFPRDTLKTINAVQAYPIDIQIVDAP